MELNKKQLELVENIFKNYNHCELGQALEQYESDYIIEMNEDTKRFFDKLKSEYNEKLAFEFDTICGNSQGASYHDGFIKGFIYAMALAGKM